MAQFAPSDRRPPVPEHRIWMRIIYGIEYSCLHHRAMNCDGAGSRRAERSNKPNQQMVAAVKSIRNQSEIVGDSLHRLTPRDVITAVSIKHTGQPYKTGYRETIVAMFRQLIVKFFFQTIANTKDRK